MIINGIELDEPDPKNFPKHLFGEYSDGKRTKVKFAWLDSYVKDGEAWCCWSYKLTLTNYGSAALDDKPVRNQAEVDWIKKFFGELK